MEMFFGIAIHLLFRGNPKALGAEQVFYGEKGKRVQEQRLEEMGKKRQVTRDRA